ncbi:helix-turn-helix domain-containing protein [Nocardia sp. NPDC049190]|uniref:AraC family transcriptional regulator n=1 Tax=Nocardia sp. NPDC049190 TaxID=3155650 RepID=UPI0033F003B8
MGWHGSLEITPGRLVYTGQFGNTHIHNHAAVQITVATSGQIAFIDHTGTQLHAAAAIIPSGASHRIDTVGTAGAAGIVIYLEPASCAAIAATARIVPSRRTLASDWIAAASDLPSGPVASVDGVLATLLGKPSNRPTVHPCVNAATALIPTLLADGPVRITSIATAVGISADRLGRLFARDLGVTFPTYLRWARIIRAVEVARAGATLTDAAHSAGFTDSAHLNRVCHEMFGIVPSQAARTITCT